MQNQLTPDGLIFVSTLAVVILSIIPYIFFKASRNNGIALLPDFLLFGFWGSAPLPNLMILANSQKDNKALIAHEQCHQGQQRRDGVLKFWSNYIFNKEMKLKYEVEAYKVWLEVNPKDREKVIFWLMNGYDFELSRQEAEALIS